MQKAPSLYIYYSNKDKELAYRLASKLADAGIDVLYDDVLTEAGEDWRRALTIGLENADCVLALITPNSFSSEYHMGEIGMAKANVMNSNGSKLLIPVVYDNAKLPNIISDIQAIYLRNNFDESIESVVNAVFNFVDKRDSK